MDVEYDETKFAEMIVFVAAELMEDPAGGATKMNKILFFAEFAHVRAAGRPISGVEFQKLSRGPAPRTLLPVRRALTASGEISVRRDLYLGYPLDRIVPARQPNTGAFSASEHKALSDALHEFRNLTATQASDRSHEELGWRAVADGQTIPYEAALLRRPALTPRVVLRAAELAKALDANTAS